MRFRIADTFVDSLARLNQQEQKLAKTTAFDLQVNPATPGMHLHKVARSRVGEQVAVALGKRQLRPLSRLSVEAQTQRATVNRCGLGMGHCGTSHEGPQ